LIVLERFFQNGKTEPSFGFSDPAYDKELHLAALKITRKILQKARREKLREELTPEDLNRATEKIQPKEFDPNKARERIHDLAQKVLKK
jgi:hypothetical protein